MRKKLSCLLLSGALALSLAACAPAEEEPSPSPLPSAPPPESSVQVLATPEPTLSPVPTVPPGFGSTEYISLVIFPSRSVVISCLPSRPQRYFSNAFSTPSLPTLSSHW